MAVRKFSNLFKQKTRRIAQLNVKMYNLYYWGRDRHSLQWGLHSPNKVPTLPQTT